MAVPIAGFWFAELYERQLLDGLETDMVHQVQVLREALQFSESPDLHGQEEMLARMTEHTGMRLRLVDSEGQVRSDSGGQNIEIGQRPEVLAALAGRYGSSARFAPGRRRLNFFSALPLRRKGEVVGVVYGSRSTADVTHSLMALKRHLVRVFTFSLLITLVMTLFLGATISRPIAKLAGRADRIAGGDTVVPLATNSASELGELARSFERMRLRLQERANENARMAADISHELKSPLTSIRGAAELLMEGAAKDPEASDRFLRNIVCDSQRMSRTVGRLLELSRVEADSSHPVLIDLKELVRSESTARPRVQLELPAKSPSIRGRLPQLQSAIANLLDNAEQHAAQSSLVHARLWRVRGGVHFQVCNTANFISETKLARMWQRFYTTRSESGGTGLGLAIVKSAVEAHGGQVAAYCKGSEVFVGFFLPA